MHLLVSGLYRGLWGRGGTPQSSNTARGEASRPNWMRRGGTTMLGVLQLPGKVEFVPISLSGLEIRFYRIRWRSADRGIVGQFASSGRRLRLEPSSIGVPGLRCGY